MNEGRRIRRIERTRAKFIADPVIRERNNVSKIESRNKRFADIFFIIISLFEGGLFRGWLARKGYEAERL